MLVLFFISTILFAAPDYYSITAGNLLETYDTCYVELKHEGVTPYIKKVFCSDDFNISQTYNYDEQNLIVYWSFNKTISRTIDRSTRYGEIFTATETFDVSDGNTCYISVDDGYSWLSEQGLFGCGMAKVVK